MGVGAVHTDAVSDPEPDAVCIGELGREAGMESGVRMVDEEEDEEEVECELLWLGLHNNTTHTPS